MSSPCEKSLTIKLKSYAHDEKITLDEDEKSRLSLVIVAALKSPVVVYKN